MKLFFAADSDLALLPFFLNHYQSLGFDEFYCSYSGESIFDPYNIAANIVPKIVVVQEKKDTRLSHFHSIFQAFFKLIENNIGPNEWYGITELDEFFDFPEKAQNIIDKAEKGGYDTVYGQTVDRVAEDGSLPELQSGIPLEQQFPRTSNISDKIVKACQQKVLLVKGHKSIGGGNHGVRNGCNIYPIRFNSLHYKWFAQILRRMEARIMLPTDEGEGWIAGNKACLDYWNQHHSVLI